MADYYPLLSRAVAGMPDNTPESRAAIYDRARTALLSQLQASDPPLAEAAITRERLTLEDAIRRVEDALAGLPPLAGQEAAPSPVPTEPMRRPEPPPVAMATPPLRPRVMPKAAKPRRSRALWIVLALLVPITGAMGFLAYKLNLRDRTVVQQPVAVPPGQDPQANSKVTERLGEPDVAVKPNRPPVTPNTNPPQTTVASVPETRPQAAVSVAQRAVLLQENPANQQDIIANQGSVAWRADSESPGSGQPLETVIKGSFDFPDQKLRGEMIVRRNSDPALPASHTIDVQFKPEAGSPVGSVKAVGLIEARENEQTRGVTLGGSPFPVAENYFLIGLTNAEPIRTRNLQLLRERDWFYMEIQFSSGRRGAVLLERGEVGRRIFGEALASWQE